MMKTCVSVVLFLLSCITFPTPTLVGATFTWDKDSVGIDCKAREEAGRCTKDATTFYQCPDTCTKHKQAAGVKKQGEADNPEEFWELEIPLSNSKTMSFDRFEGYITLVVVIPLMPGLAQYYYDMMEHIHQVYPFSIEILVYPLRREDHPDVQLKLPKKTKIIVLPELVREGDKIEANPVLDYLEAVIAPNNPFIFTDRVTAYIVAFNAKFIEKQGSPKLDFMEKLIAHYLTEMELYLKSEF